LAFFPATGWQIGNMILLLKILLAVGSGVVMLALL
jgi:hypothetical protein